MYIIDCGIIFVLIETCLFCFHLKEQYFTSYKKVYTQKRQKVHPPYSLCHEGASQKRKN